MKKVYKVEVDCAACASKIEDSIKKLDSVNDASINFMTQKMTLAAPDGQEKKALNDAVKAAQKIDADFEVVK